MKTQNNIFQLITLFGISEILSQKEYGDLIKNTTFKNIGELVINEEWIDEDLDVEEVETLIKEFYNKYKNTLSLIYIDVEDSISLDLGNKNIRYVESLFEGDYCNYIIMSSEKEIIDEIKILKK